MMRRFTCSLFLLFASVISLYSQSSYSISRYVADLGNIEVWNNDTARFTIVNTGSKVMHLLPTLPSDDMQVLITSKSIQPGESAEIGLVYYTEHKGRFSREVSLYFSAFPKPVVLTVKGNIRQFDANALVRCPSIEPGAQEQARLLPVSIIVRDAETDRRLDSAEVTLRQKQQYYKCSHGFGMMAYVAKVPSGSYEVQVSHQGYEPYSGQYRFEEGNNTLIVYLDKKRERPAEKEPEVVFSQDTTVQYIPSSLRKDTIKPVIPAIPKEDFDITMYAPNNIVFLIDISSSMSDSTKLEYLKISLKQLISMLRTHDYVTVITYSNKTRTLVQNISGSEKNTLYTCIDTLQAKGGSRGAEGLRMAYDNAKAHFIPGGNNQVILATDGIFNDPGFTEKQLYKLARSNAENKIKLSVVAFGKQQTALSFLENLSKNGKGEFLRINTRAEARNTLTEEIRKQSEIK